MTSDTVDALRSRKTPAVQWPMAFLQRNVYPSKGYPMIKDDVLLNDDVVEELKDDPAVDSGYRRDLKLQ
jgi:hypothetical protein